MAYSGSFLQHPDNAAKFLSWAVSHQRKEALRDMAWAQGYFHPHNLRASGLGRMLFLAKAGHEGECKFYWMYEIWVIQAFCIKGLDRLGANAGMVGRIAIPMLTQMAKFGFSMGAGQINLPGASLIDAGGVESLNAVHQRSVAQAGKLAEGDGKQLKRAAFSLASRKTDGIEGKTGAGEHRIVCVLGQISGGTEADTLQNNPDLIHGGHVYIVAQATPLMRSELGELFAYHQSTGRVLEFRWGEPLIGNRFKNERTWTLFGQFRGALQSTPSAVVKAMFADAHPFDAWISGHIRSTATDGQWSGTQDGLVVHQGAGGPGRDGWRPWLPGDINPKHHTSTRIAELMPAMQ